MRKPTICIGEKKTQISFVVTSKLISAFVFTTRRVQSLFILNPEFQASSCLLWLYSPVFKNHIVGFPTRRLKYYRFYLHVLCLVCLAVLYFSPMHLVDASQMTTFWERASHPVSTEIETIKFKIPTQTPGGKENSAQNITKCCSSYMLQHFVMFCAELSFPPGPSCSKLTTSLVNILLKFQTLILQIHFYFLLKK